MKLGDIADFIGGKLYGDCEVEINDIAAIESAVEGEIAFLANPKYQPFIEESKASAIILPKGEWDVGQPYIICENPYYGFALLMQHFHPITQKQKPQIHQTAQVADETKLGKDVAIGANVIIESDVSIGDNTNIFPGCYIGKNAQIGKEVTLYPNVTVREEVEIGNGVIIHSGAVIGSDGFGFAQEKGEYFKIPQIGNVVIEGNVEIGANCCIDRATLGETRIHRGAKLDNLIQIAHNVEIGENTVIAAQTGISGSTKIGNYCMLGGQVGFVGHITIGDKVICGAQAGVTKSIKDNVFVSGYPARPHRQQLKIEAVQMKLPEILKRLRKLEEKIGESDKSK